MSGAPASPLACSHRSKDAASQRPNTTAISANDYKHHVTHGHVPAETLITTFPNAYLLLQTLFCKCVDGWASGPDPPKAASPSSLRSLPSDYHVHKGPSWPCVCAIACANPNMPSAQAPTRQPGSCHKLLRQNSVCPTDPGPLTHAGRCTMTSLANLLRHPRLHGRL